MSNYLAVVVAAELSPRVRGWLAERGAPADEVHVAPLGEGHELVLVGRDVARCVEPGRFFKGVAVSPEHGAIGFGVDGWRSMPESVRADPHGVAGEFVLVEWDDEQVAVRRDVFGAVSLAWTAGPGVVAASDSLLVLVDLRRRLGLPVTQDAEHLLARSAANGVSGQQTGERTHVVEIAYTAAGRGLRVDVPGPVPVVDGALLTDRVVDVEVDEVAETRDVATFLARAMGTLATREDMDVRLMLSGGQDSRVLLGGALRAGTAHRLVIECNDNGPKNAADVAVVRTLADRFGLTVNGPRRFTGPETPAGPALAVLASSTLGFYDLSILRGTVRTGAVGINGTGAELYKGNWGWRPVEALADHYRVADARRDAFVAQVSAGVRACGGDPDWADASEILYCGYRNGIHGAGPHIAVGMTGLRPLHQLGIARLGHRRVDGRAPREDRGTATVRGAQVDVMASLLALMHPELAVMPYDMEKKTLTPPVVAAHLEALGGPLGAAADEPLSITGLPQDVPAGPSALGIGVAEANGFGGRADVHSLLAVADRGVEAIVDPQVRVAYAELLAKARWRLVTKGEAPRQAGTALGKLLAATAVA
ncbi:hypothetical protein KIN34_09865 [Cellulomonas sp. DKR-3]|uniref:Asparagine synthetase domain-containing protein n=1 Tax=Cellulomonas fulva TaxID=2835530 RepID=A0ABS5TZK3_9CELL|nr:hypothetical protein [Cellulomonas fulva]MBT0994592.1 hypothetical protein [Cellulomonas fulva]